jgi:hypothetical protein
MTSLVQLGKVLGVVMVEGVVALDTRSASA